MFKEAILILNNFNCYLINLSGYKKLNGSQLVKENITYIINSLKSKINEIEEHKTILHIFNSKYNLDKKILKIYQSDYSGNSTHMSYLFFN